MGRQGNVDKARFHIVEFRGFERFVQGHPYWEASLLVQRLCGICPVSHHLAAAKAIDQISDLSSRGDALSHNQLARWVMTKETHATNTQKIIAQYFMTQRIKPTSENYTKQLTAAHAVLIAAMKCKQTVDADSAKALKEAIYNLYRAYEGKEPNFE